MKKIVAIFSSLIFCFSYGQDKADAITAFDSSLFSEYSNVRDVTFNATDDEVYFSLQNFTEDISVLAKSQKIDNKWQEPKILTFSGVYRDLEPFLSNDGLTLYFVSNRPIEQADEESKDFDIWLVKRNNNKSPWGDPINLGSPINTTNNEFYPSLAENGNMYFTSDANTSTSKDDIFYSKWNGKQYETPIALPKGINTEGYEFNSFIAKDESFLIFSGYNREDGIGSGDLYISFKESDKWTQATNLGHTINSDKMDYCPFYDEKSKMLYFTSKRYKRLDPINMKSIEDYKKIINSTQNGMSRIYKVPYTPIKN